MPVALDVSYQLVDNHSVPHRLNSTCQSSDPLKQSILQSARESHEKGHHLHQSAPVVSACPYYKSISITWVKSGVTTVAKCSTSRPLDMIFDAIIIHLLPSLIDWTQRKKGEELAVLCLAWKETKAQWLLGFSSSHWAKAWALSLQLPDSSTANRDNRFFVFPPQSGLVIPVSLKVGVIRRVIPNLNQKQVMEPIQKV